jgi:hypothetical protein
MDSIAPKRPWEDISLGLDDYDEQPLCFKFPNTEEDSPFDLDQANDSNMTDSDIPGDYEGVCQMPVDVEDEPGLNEEEEDDWIQEQYPDIAEIANNIDEGFQNLQTPPEIPNGFEPVPETSGPAFGTPSWDTTIPEMPEEHSDTIPSWDDIVPDINSSTPDMPSDEIPSWEDIVPDTPTSIMPGNPLTDEIPPWEDVIPDTPASPDTPTSTMPDIPSENPLTDEIPSWDQVMSDTPATTVPENPLTDEIPSWQDILPATPEPVAPQVPPPSCPSCPVQEQPTSTPEAPSSCYTPDASNTDSTPLPEKPSCCSACQDSTTPEAPSLHEDSLPCKREFDIFDHIPPLKTSVDCLEKCKRLQNYMATQGCNGVVSCRRVDRLKCPEDKCNCC